MKHFQTYSDNRKKLIGLQEDRSRYFPTTRTIKEWFEVINEQMFEHSLKDFDTVIVKSMGDYHAMFTSFDDDTTQLEMHRSFDNEKLFVEILSHECVHLYQYLHDEPVDHGPTFRKWREKFMHFNLKLHRTF